MTTYRPTGLVIATAFALLTACAFASAAPAEVAGKVRSAAPVQPAGQTVEYATLAQHVGDEIVVETTLNTVRRGTLVKYTNPTLTLQLGPEHGSIELSVPHETVRSVRVLKAAPAAQPQTDAQQQQGHRSAQKN